MKFNWGSGIALFFTCFAVTMVFAVIRTTHYKPQLVQSDYYALDLDYQARIEKKQHTAALPAPPAVRLTTDSDSIRVMFPAGMAVETGTVKCYRPVTTLDDFCVEFSHATVVDIPAASLASGRWNIELDWTAADGKSYYYTTSVFIPAG